ncbi:hypothetical protein RM553_02265 [Zunongwangia sp. F363]|uniref:Uncharacterized protein n=1 Tax=Autumnicola tepida TaxID=3075595 RepID=A0ABU3C5P0_9FLAO|nr:hypothetical protein [Zunongwangia sp. F363]MDT0641646.1 hypothetical protein [Zunongwangia sp. F363]
MASYLNKDEIAASLKVLIKQYVKDCEDCGKLSPEFINLIKHNFLAEYVVYDKEAKTVEIGIEVSDTKSVYPEIKVYQFSLKSAEDWVAKSCKEENSDLEFYGKLLNKNDILNSSDVVLLQ